MAILISFLYLLLYIAIVIFIAFCVVWLIQAFMGWTIPPDIYKWGKVIVGLICIIAVVVWLSGLFGYGPGLPHPILNYR